MNCAEYNIAYCSMSKCYKEIMQLAKGEIYAEHFYVEKCLGASYYEAKF